MQLQKTDRGRAELQPGVRTLGQRERALLLLADGSKSAQDLRAFFNGEGEHIVVRLVQGGFLAPAPGTAPVTAPAAAPNPAAAIATAAPLQAIAADAFDGKRSLATTRMYLFDTCERLFARRDPARAALLREALRSARDRDTMLATAHTMLDELVLAGGQARAEAIRERIALLLPADTAGDAA